MISHKAFRHLRLLSRVRDAIRLPYLLLLPMLINLDGMLLSKMVDYISSHVLRNTSHISHISVPRDRVFTPEKWAHTPDSIPSS